MGQVEQDQLNVEILFEVWAQKQQSFEKDIQMLLDKSKELAKQINDALETPTELPNEKALTQKQFKINELMIHLREELERRQAQTNAKQRLQDWITNLDNMRARITTISQSLSKVGLADASIINQLCQSQEYTQHNYELLSQEVQRCEALRRQNLSRLIKHVSAEINQWCDLTLQYPAKQNYEEGCDRDLVLEKLEQQLAELKGYYNQNKPIFDVYGRRVNLWTRMEALEDKSKEPNRFHNRGGQLLQEERERKIISIKLPQIEQQLRKLVKEYEKRTKQPFLVYGEEILAHIAADWEEYRASKEKQIKERTVSPNMSYILLRKTASVPHLAKGLNETLTKRKK